MNQKIYSALTKVVKETIAKESPGLSKKRNVTLDKESSFMESLDVDSLLALEIVSKIEKKFGIQVQEEDFVHFDKIENIVNLIENKIADKFSPKLKFHKTTSKIDKKHRKNRPR